MSEKIKAYKGFKPDMTCRGFQYEEEKEYHEDRAECCEAGFHACEIPLDVFKYYKPSESVYHEVEQSGEFSKNSDDSKVASTKIKIGAKIGISGLVKDQIDFIFKKIKWVNDAENNTSGYRSSAATSHQNSVALACGKNAKAKGVVGSYIVLTEWNEESDTLLSAQMVRIDGDKYKEHTFYTMRDGKIVEAEDD